MPAEHKIPQRWSPEPSRGAVGFSYDVAGRDGMGFCFSFLGLVGLGPLTKVAHQPTSASMDTDCSSEPAAGPIGKSNNRGKFLV